MGYIADPNAGDAQAILVCSVSDEQEARNAARNYEREWVDLHRERELREIARTMNQRHSFAG